eukprot:2214214-Pleurochrysis_carterae.AAC.4
MALRPLETFFIPRSPINVLPTAARFFRGISARRDELAALGRDHSHDDRPFLHRREGRTLATSHSVVKRVGCLGSERVVMCSACKPDAPLAVSEKGLHLERGSQDVHSRACLPNAGRRDQAGRVGGAARAALAPNPCARRAAQRHAQH